MVRTQEYLQEVGRVSANNYLPLPIVLNRGQGVWVWDVDGKKYLDMLACYSALNQGHCHPRIVEVVKGQVEKLTLTSRAFHNDQMGPFLKKLCQLTGYERALPMNTGAEAVETAIKCARRWGYRQKKIKPDKAEIIVCQNNFHGRTTTIIGFSSEALYRDGFGPFTPGFKMITYDDVVALESAINENTAAFLVEPLQGEGGVIVPRPGYLKKVREITKRHNVLLVADEVQTGLGRTGKLLACEHEGVRADIVILGKALGGGIYPVSAIVGGGGVMDSFVPGNHGSTFGGNPLASAIGSVALDVIVEEKLPERAVEMGAYLLGELKKIKHPAIQEVRGQGLLTGVEIKKEYGPARLYCEKLAGLGVLSKETHDQVVRFTPPLIISGQEVDWALERIQKLFS